MPVKLRRSKARPVRVTPEALARWRVVRPHGLHFAGTVCPADFVDDDELGELLGQPALLATTPEHLQAIHDALEDAHAR